MLFNLLEKQRQDEEDVASEDDEWRAALEEERNTDEAMRRQAAAQAVAIPENMNDGRTDVYPDPGWPVTMAMSISSAGSTHLASSSAHTYWSNMDTTVGIGGTDGLSGGGITDHHHHHHHSLLSPSGLAVHSYSDHGSGRSGSMRYTPGALRSPPRSSFEWMQHDHDHPEYHYPSQNQSHNLSQANPSTLSSGNMVGGGRGRGQVRGRNVQEAMAVMRFGTMAGASNSYHRSSLPGEQGDSEDDDESKSQSVSQADNRRRRASANDEYRLLRLSETSMELTGATSGGGSYTIDGSGPRGIPWSSSASSGVEYRQRSIYHPETSLSSGYGASSGSRLGAPGDGLSSSLHQLPPRGGLTLGGIPLSTLVLLREHDEDVDDDLD